MSEVIASSVLANGLRSEFADTYNAIRNRQADSRLGQVMDLSIAATNRTSDFAYFEAAPHMTFWERGDTIPSDAMDSVSFSVSVYEFARRIAWNKNDRKDDQISALMDSARQTGESAALLPERFLIDLLTNNAGTLPAVPTAPDGAIMFATTAGGADRFGVTDGNLLTGSTVNSVSAIQTDFYNCIEQWKQMEDGKGQPLLSSEAIDSGQIIFHAPENTEVFEEAFLQRRQGIVLGADAGTTPSNLMQDASRTVQLWSTARLSGNDWYVFLKNPPKKATFLLNREGVQELQALEGDNNSDHVRDTGQEYVQWEERSGAGIALPFAAIMVNN